MAETEPQPRRSIVFTFPIDADMLARLELPADGLRTHEADRLVEFIRALVVDSDAS